MIDLNVKKVLFGNGMIKSRRSEAKRWISKIGLGNDNKILGSYTSKIIHELSDIFCHLKTYAGKCVNHKLFHYFIISLLFHRSCQRL